MVCSSLLVSFATAAVAISANTEPTNLPREADKRPLVNSKALQASIERSALEQKGHELENAAYSTPDRNRVFSSPGHENTLDFISGYLDTVADYYTYTRQPFEALYSQASGNFSADGTDYEPSIFQYSASGSVTAPIVAVANLGCNATDYPAEVAGNVALISRGTCEFGLKSALAGAAGAVASIIYNNVPGEFLAGTLGPPPRPEGDYVPTVGITQENATAILAALTGGEAIEAVIDVNSIIENRTTYNIVAETISGDKDNVLAIGGHTDSVFAGPGINDDGSGTIGILEVALQLAKFRINNAVRVLFWSGEEFGLLGSTYYVENLSAEELLKIRLYLNFDMIASPNYVYALYDGDGSAFNVSGPPGSAEVEAFFTKWFERQGVPTTETDFDGRSDYGPFLAANVPAGGIFTGAEGIKTAEEAATFGGTAGEAYDPNYHGPGDNFTNLNFDAFTTNTKAIAAAVAKYSKSFKSIPPRTTNGTAPVRARSAHVPAHPHKKRQLKSRTVHNKHDCANAPKAMV